MAKTGESYADEKRISEGLDLQLGFEIPRVESLIRTRLQKSARAITENPEQTWSHLSPQIFQTPYLELERTILAADPDSQIKTWVDIGAAYGRLGIVLARLRPNARFTGLELVPERVEEGRRVYELRGLRATDLRCVDVTDTPLPPADLYFIYDFGHRSAIDQILEKIKIQARAGPVTVVGRGRAVRDAIERSHPWLSSIRRPLHETHYSIYYS